MTVIYPAAGFSSRNYEILRRLIYSKQTLLRRIFEIDSLNIIVRDDGIRFPWFPDAYLPEELSAYNDFVHRLCRRAYNMKYVLALDRPLYNERYQGSSFLISLGMDGKNRHILLNKLSGNYTYATMRKSMDADWLSYAQQRRQLSKKQTEHQ